MTKKEIEADNARWRKTLRNRRVDLSKGVHVHVWMHKPKNPNQPEIITREINAEVLEDVEDHYQVGFKFKDRYFELRIWK